MRNDEKTVDDQELYDVVVNDEEQYSIWWADRAPPAGWRTEGTRDDRATCLARIAEVWTDMRPAGLRRRMAAGEAR